MELPVSIKTPRLIRDRCGVYYFRLIVPLALRDSIGKTELRRSLRTKEADIARHRALILSVQVETVMVDPKFLTNPTIGDFAHLLRPDAKRDTRKLIEIDMERGIFRTDTLDEADRAVKLAASYAEAKKIAAQSGIVSILPSSKCGTVLEKAKNDYLDERITSLKDSTWRKHRGVIQAFIKTMGNLDVAMVNSTTVTDFKKSLLALSRAATTINDQISILFGFFEYCISNVTSMANPARHLFVVGASNKAESYEPFENSELQKIFQPALYRKKMKLPDYYWAPLIALFTGARAEEIASLDAGHIYPVKGIWIIHIREGKTENAERRVPIHQTLLDLGLVDYRWSVVNAGYKKLFPNALPGLNGYKKNLSRTFGTYLDLPEVNIVHELKVFHSFRHTVVTALTNAGVNEGLKRALVGHDIDTRTSSHDDYIHFKSLTLPNLQEAINKLHYEGMDFEKLKLPKDGFLPAIAKRLIEQAKQKKKKAKKAAAKAKAEVEAKAEAEAEATFAPKI
jgi:integrase